MTADLFDIRGKAALVTGGAEGIGADIARQLAAAGAAVAVIDRNADGAAALAETLGRQGAHAVAVAADLAEEDSIAAAIAEARHALGGLDILVNNAGLQNRAHLLDTSAELWDLVHRVNSRGLFLCLREAARIMRADGRGERIVNVSSIGAIHPVMPGLAAYNASKAAVTGLTRSAALELSPDGITVNAVLPGGIATAGAARTPGPAPSGRIVAGPPPLGRPVEAGDIAAAILFLASPAAAMITGQSIVIDGGYLLT